MLGFRSNKLWKKILSITYLVFWGIIFLVVMLDGKFKNITMYDFIISKIQNLILLTIFVSPYIFLSNTKFRSKMPLFKANKKFKSFLGIIIVNIIFFIIFGVVNGFHSQEYLADMANHDYQIIKQTEATCEDTGTINYQCDYCGTTKTDIIDALGHDKKETSKKEPTCDVEGVLYEECNRCGKKSETPISALGHDLKEISKKEANCDNEGMLVEKCERCGETKETTLQPLGHSMKEHSKTEAVCEKGGSIIKKCEKCGKTEETVISASGHKMKEISNKKATCEENGLVVKKCEVCGKTEETKSKALGHKMKEISRKQPTENTDGNIIRKCSVCNKEEVETIRRLGKTEEEYKAECVYVSYEDIARNPDNYKGTFAVFSGQVAQVQESGNNVVIRLNVTRGAYGIWEDTVYIEYTKAQNESRILEEDIITVYGQLNGIKTYTAVLGNSISIPHLKAKYVEIN